MLFESGVLFFTNLHNKTSHFVTFFSISPLFVQKVRHFVKKSTFFCHGQRTNPHFQPKNKPLKNSRYTKTQKTTSFCSNNPFFLRFFLILCSNFVQTADR